MAIPEATLAIKDGALGAVPANVNGTQAILGVCSTGTVDTVYEFGDPQTMKETLGTGPLVDQAAHVLSVAGGPVICVRITGSVAGTVGSVTLAGTGLSVLTTTGSVPLDSYQAAIKIITGGTNPAAGTATFRVSLDGGLTYGPESSLPTSGVYAIPSTGLTLNFSAASLVALDVYTFSSVAPSYSVANFNTAMNALLADSREWFLANVVGVPADTTAMAALFAALDSKLTTAASQFRYTAGLMSAADDTDGNLDTAMTALSSTRVVVAAGFENVVSAVNGSQLKRSASFSIAARASAATAPADLARVHSGYCLGFTKL